MEDMLKSMLTLGIVELILFLSAIFYQLTRIANEMERLNDREDATLEAEKKAK